MILQTSDRHIKVALKEFARLATHEQLQICSMSSPFVDRGSDRSSLEFSFLVFFLFFYFFFNSDTLQEFNDLISHLAWLCWHFQTGVNIMTLWLGPNWLTQILRGENTSSWQGLGKLSLLKRQTNVPPILIGVTITKKSQKGKTPFMGHSVR